MAVVVIVHVVLYGRLAAGVSVKLVAGDALCEKAIGDPFGHCTENAFAVALTLSLKLIDTAELTATAVAPLAGAVVVTVGAASDGAPPCAVTERSSTASP